MNRITKWGLTIALCTLALPLFGGEGLKVTVKRLGERSEEAKPESTAKVVKAEAPKEAPKSSSKASAESSPKAAPDATSKAAAKRLSSSRASLGPKLQIRVRLETKVELGTLVRLSDVVELKSDAKGVWAHLKDVVVAGGKKRWVSRSDLERRIRGAGVPLDAVRIQGPAVCRVSNRGGGGR